MPFERWRADPAAELERICAAHDLGPIATDALHQNTEGHVSPHNAVRLRERARAIVSTHWADGWQPIFAKLGFELDPARG